jgi:hypothetical protein
VAARRVVSKSRTFVIKAVGEPLLSAPTPPLQTQFERAEFEVRKSAHTFYPFNYMFVVKYLCNT